MKRARLLPDMREVKRRQQLPLEHLIQEFEREIQRREAGKAFAARKARERAAAAASTRPGAGSGSK